jgi:hypothetical protein
MLNVEHNVSAGGSPQSTLNASSRRSFLGSDGDKQEDKYGEKIMKYMSGWRYERGSTWRASREPFIYTRSHSLDKIAAGLKNFPSFFVVRRRLSNAQCGLRVCLLYAARSIKARGRIEGKEKVSSESLYHIFIC